MNIFVSVGTQKFAFDRLIKKMDELATGSLKSATMFAQIGHSKYIPQNMQSVKFLDKQQFAQKLDWCDVFVTHGGVGSIIEGLKAGKKVVVVPRLGKFKEHIDDHQTQIATKYAELGYVLVSDGENLLQKIEETQNFESKFVNYPSSAKQINEFIIEYIKKL